MAMLKNIIVLWGQHWERLRCEVTLKPSLDSAMLLARI